MAYVIALAALGGLGLGVLGVVLSSRSASSASKLVAGAALLMALFTLVLGFAGQAMGRRQVHRVLSSVAPDTGAHPAAGVPRGLPLLRHRWHRRRDPAGPRGSGAHHRLYAAAPADELTAHGRLVRPALLSGGQPERLARWGLGQAGRRRVHRFVAAGRAGDGARDPPSSTAARRAIG